MRRKPNPEERRRQLCDAAIRLLADDGAKGLSHLKVDRKVGVPDGTTSFYFRTRSSLLEAVARRIADLDLQDLTAATTTTPAAPGRPGDSRPSGLATLVIRSAAGEGLVRTKARYELALQAARDPVLDGILRHYTDQFFSLIRDVVLRLRSPGAPADRGAGDGVAEEAAREAARGAARGAAEETAHDETVYVVMMFISGIMFAFASGDRRVRTAEELDLLISGIVAGVDARVDAGLRGPAAPPRNAGSRRGRRRRA
ncbi:TetR/AcrR family transcriptional regulator [Mycolicibacterium palauense]|uniref:TetR/AcrR family transcriptional regulator n=1 Tax=Mycolicibacterium palauense TaxID=2034511 RepID=UPI000BFEB9C2|nr:TetR family transcriptional regulator [Mycolicibacterium palauense]